MRRKTLLAIAFVGGFFGASQPFDALSKTPQSAQQSSPATPSDQDSVQKRAYQLLTSANNLLDGKDEHDGPTIHSHRVNRWGELDWTSWPIDRSQDKEMERWTDSIASDTKFTTDRIAISQDQLVRAKSNLYKALNSLDHSRDKSANLNLYFVATRLFEKSGDSPGRLKSDKVLQQLIQSIEKDQSICDEKEISTAAAILNFEAESLIPTNLSETNVDPQTLPIPLVKNFKESDFENAERLRLRSIALVDRLDKSNHVRRKDHRDMVLWYLAFGKQEKADKEKYKLIDLVGFQEFDILYPQAAGCGHWVWWTAGNSTFACGMG